MAVVRSGYAHPMGLLDRLLGRAPRDSYREQGSPSWGTPASQPPPSGPPSYGREPGTSRDQARRDEEAIRRYRYLLRTAPPEAVEQAHAEAFAQLSPDQRRQVLGELAHGVPEHERARSDDPRALARMATRAELRQPGFLERTFGGQGPGYGRGYGGGGYGRGGGFAMGGGMGMGGMIAGGLLASIAGTFIGTAIAQEVFDQNDYMASDFSEGGDGGSDLNFDNEQVDASGVDSGGGDVAGDAGGQEFGDFGGGGGDFGDFGGGDFGGGDW